MYEWRHFSVTQNSTQDITHHATPCWASLSTALKHFLSPLGEGSFPQLGQIGLGGAWMLQIPPSNAIFSNCSLTRRIGSVFSMHGGHIFLPQQRSLPVLVLPCFFMSTRSFEISWSHLSNKSRLISFSKIDIRSSSLSTTLSIRFCSSWTSLRNLSRARSSSACFKPPKNLT